MDFFNLAKELIEPLIKADINKNYKCGELYKFNITYCAVRDEPPNNGVYAFLIHLKPKRRNVGAPEFRFNITMTGLKLEEKTIECKVKVSLSKSYIKFGTGKEDKLKSKAFKYKINVNGYSKESLDKMEKEILAWTSSRIGEF